MESEKSPRNDDRACAQKIRERASMCASLLREICRFDVVVSLKEGLTVLFSSREESFSALFIVWMNGGRLPVAP